MTAPLITATTPPADWAQAIEDIALITNLTAKTVLESVGAEMMDYFQSLTEEERGWASITGELAAGYRYTVAEAPGGGWRLTLANTVYYSVFLEARDGMFVLSGVTDPGGPVEQKLKEVCARVAPSLLVVVRGVQRAPRVRRRRKKQ